MASESEDLLQEAREAFEEAATAEQDNRTRSLEDKRFARLGGEEQWPLKIVEQRRTDGRPYLTINRMPAFIRQVVNDGRQNRPQIKVRPVDNKADIATADVFSGIIRNIEVSSNADVAYDTGLEHAVDGGFGYISVSLEYAHDDTFDQELRIERVANPFAVFGDPYSTAADSADWNAAFMVDLVPEDVFERDYKAAEKVDWETLGYGTLKAPWVDSSGGKKVIQVASWWKREEVKKKVVLLSDGQTLGRDVYDMHKDTFDSELKTILKEREVRGWKVTHRKITGAEILSTTEWAGQYIPIVPVYGDEVNIEGERILRSLIRDAKDPQRMFNYWRTTSTELVALAPKVPFIGEEGAFDVDPNWSKVSTHSLPFLMFKRGSQPPQRQPLDTGGAIGAMQEALAASDDMKAAVGLYDASLGQKSNETSGVAINARQREGDVSTFHFLDNQTRAIRHVGRILIDLIPKVYSGPRIVRILGQDGKVSMAAVKSKDGALPDGVDPNALPQGMAGVFDLNAGKYDLAVEAGPSYTTKRQEAAANLTELIRAFPQGAPVIAPTLLKYLDVADAEQMSQRLEAMLNPQPQQPPADPAKAAELQAKQEIETGKLEVQRYDSETKRLDTIIKAISPLLAPLVQQELAKLMGSPDITPGGPGMPQGQQGVPMLPPGGPQGAPPRPPGMPPGPMPPPNGAMPQPQPAPAGFSMPGAPDGATG